MQWHVRKATLEDIRDLAPRLRELDIQEIYAGTGLAPLECLELSLSLPSVGVWVGVYKDKPEIIFGLSKVNDDEGCPWMVCTDELKNSPTEFIKKCRSWVQGFSRQFPLIRNYVYAKNELHIRWLKWCGFDFIKLHEHHGFTQEPFWEFEMRQHKE